MEWLVVVLWGLGAAVAVAAPAAVLVAVTVLRERRDWTRLPRTGAKVTGPSPVPPAALDAALRAFAVALQDRFGGTSQSRAEGAFHHLRLVFKAGDSYFIPTPLGKDLEVRGHLASPDEVHLAARGAGIGETALFHELVHWFLGKTAGSPDANHAAAPGPWTTEHDLLVEELERRYRRDVEKNGSVQEAISAFVDSHVVRKCGTCER